MKRFFSTSGMKPLHFVFSFFILAIIFSCNSANSKSQGNSNLRQVYSEYKLGMSGEEAMEQLYQNVLNGKYKTKKGFDKELYYEEHKTSDGKKYYSIIQFKVPEGDTTVTEVKLIFACSPTMYLGSAIDASNRGEDFMFSRAIESSIDDNTLTRDILRKLNATYNRFDDSTVINGESPDWVETYHWNDRNGVDIALKRIGDNQLHPDYGNQYFYHVALSYKYTNEMMKRFGGRQSKF